MLSSCQVFLLCQYFVYIVDLYAQKGIDYVSILNDIQYLHVM